MSLPKITWEVWCFATFLGFTSDGCTMCPDSVWGWNIAHGDNAWPPLPCDLHDLRYWIGGNELDRMAADYELRDAILSISDRRYWPLSALTVLRADEIYLAVSELGASHFNYVPVKR